MTNIDVSSLVREIKELFTSGDRALEDFYKQIGERLKLLKKHKPSNIRWDSFVKEKCGISNSRACTYINIADGKITLAEHRAYVAKKTREYSDRQKSITDGDTVAVKQQKENTKTKTRAKTRTKTKPGTLISITDQANTFHRELMETYTDFESRFRAWFKSNDVDKDAKDMMHDALMLVADGFMQLAQQLDNR